MALCSCYCTIDRVFLDTADYASTMLIELVNAYLFVLYAVLDLKFMYGLDR